MTNPNLAVLRPATAENLMRSADDVMMLLEANFCERAAADAVDKDISYLFAYLFSFRYTRDGLADKHAVMGVGSGT